MPDLVLLGVAIIIAGILVIFLATIFSSHSEAGVEGKRAGVKGGGVIMIGPIPIIFGSDAKWTAIAIALAIVLVALSLVLTRVQ